MNRTLASAQATAKPAPLPKLSCVHQMFERQARQTPSAVAVSQGLENVTYGELDAAANQLAHYLIKLGVRPETRVALYLERTPRIVLAILGVLKAGGAYVPIDLAYPKDRAAFMLQDAAAPVVITTRESAPGLGQHASVVVMLDTEWPTISSESTDMPSVTMDSDNAAYVIYTSGSTGKPKGVIVTHANVVRLLQETSHWYKFNSSDVWPLFHSYAFDVSVWELWGSLFNGGRLVVVPYLVTRSPAEFYELLSREKVTVLNQTPSAFRQLIWAEESAPQKLPLSLRYVICAGEALELQSLKPWFDRHGDEQPRIVNMYGITETTVHSSYRVIRKADLASGVGSVIGLPIPDLQIYLVDDDLRLVPKGAPGEICVGGAGVARGYLNRPELTAKRFIKDPFSNDPGARLYRSGDLAQYNSSGELEYLGRMDHQVKIRGFRVELGEIESALNRCPGIRESVVVARENASGDKRLVAYVVLAEKAAGEIAGRLNISDLRLHLAQVLPDYMLPAAFVFLGALPLTTNGKVDRRALPEPSAERPKLKTEFVPAQTPEEQLLAAIWSDVLELEQVGIGDNFFELGGDSIRCIRILSCAQQAGLALTLEQIFAHPTVQELCAIAGEAAKADWSRTSKQAAVQGEGRSTPFSLISPEDRAKLPDDAEDAYPIGKLQLGMFFRNELNPASAVYHDVFSFRIQSPFQQEAIEQAVELLTKRHPVLRTSFHIAGFDEPLQIVHRTVKPLLTVEDLCALNPERQAGRVAEWIEKEKRRSFDRARAPLVRFHVQVRSATAFQFIFSFHHSCLDGWSLAAAMTELFQDYSALLRQAAPTTHAPAALYRDFIALERKTLADEAARKFWQTELVDASTGLLPRWPKSMCEGGLEQKRGPEVTIKPEILESLRHLAHRARVPLKSVLLAAHQKVMSFLYGQADVTSGLICNGRPEQADGEKVIGLFLNAAPVRMKLEGGSWLKLASDAFAAEQRLLPYRRFPLAEIQKLNGGRQVFESAFDFIHFHVYKSVQGRQDLDLKEGHYFEANDMTTYTTFMLDVTSSVLEIHIDYDPNALCRAQIEQITSYYVRTLEAMAGDPDAPHESFSPLPQPEKQQILQEWNQTAEAYPSDKQIHELFEAQAAQRPDAIALRFQDRQWTYSELNREANRVARHLRRAGLKREQLVGICLEHSAAMVVGLLGILKAGGAYVPLDAAYPAERLSFMVDDSGISILLTSRKVLEQMTDSTTGPALVAPKSADDMRLVCIDEIPDSDGQEETPITQSGRTEDLAYVIYTSGSMGRPKGVQVMHRSVVNLLCSAQRKLRMTPADNLLAVTTLSFDIAALELFVPLITGAQLTIAPREITSDAPRLAALLEASAATVMQATPVTWRMLIEAGWKGKSDLRAICGGEALKPALARDLLERCAELWNFYGPTETTIWSTALNIRPGQPVTIGKPLANTRTYILNADLQVVPVGAVGELCIGGDGVARGYLNRPELTKAKFLPDPFVPGARIYRTGDLARYLPDGSIDCLGRLDQQVKIRGFRIELGEIEAALRQFPGIADAVVAPREDRFGEMQLTGYLRSKNGPPDLLGLRHSLTHKLPFYMVPTHFVVLKEFPLTPNGKINTRALPSPDLAASANRVCVPPRSDDEQALLEVWREVLGVKEISVDDNFFDLGGDSLSATRVFARINRIFSANITLREILEHPTIGQLSPIVRQARGSGPAAVVIPRQPRTVST